MGEDLELNLTLNRSPAKAEAEAVRRDLAAVNRGMAADSKKASDDAAAWYTDAQGRMRDATGKFVSDARKAQAGLATGFGDVGKAGVVGFGGIAAAAGVAMVAFTAAKSILSGIGAELGAVGEKAKQLSKDLAGNRDQLRELAGLRGETADAAFTVKLHEEAKRARMTFPEMKEFGTEFYGSGAQQESKFGSDQFKAYRDKAAAYTVAQGIDSGTGGDFAGTFAGMRDYSKVAEGKRAGAALDDMNTSFAVLQRGRGSNSVLARQMSKVGASMVNESQMRGIFQSPTEAATAVSTAAEANPSEAFEAIRSAAKGLRDFGGKAKDLLTEAGINAQTSFTESIKRLAPVVERKAREQGVKVDDILRTNFEDIQTSSAIGVQINRGVGSGVYADREAVARGAMAPGQGQKVIDRFAGSEAGRQREAEADVKLAEAERAAENSDLTTLRTQALARLIREKRIDTNATGVADFASKVGSFGAIGSAESKRIDDEVSRTMDARSGEAGPQTFALSPEARAAEMNDRIGSMRKKGVNPLLPAGDEGDVIDRREGAILKDGPGGFFDNLGWAAGNPTATARTAGDLASDALRGAMGFEKGGGGGARVAGLLERQNAILERVAKNTDPPPAPVPRPMAGPAQVRR